MAAIGTLTISGTVLGSPSGTKTIAPPVITSAAACDEVLPQALLSGDNTIAIPANATAMVITPPVGNAIALKIKGAGGDTGIFISKTLPTLLSFDVPPPASIIVNAGGAIAALTEFNFV